MNIIKHMEAAFIVSLAVAGIASAAYESAPHAAASTQAQTQAQAERSIATAGSMAVVKVSAKRMSYSEKQQSLALERSGRRA